MNNIQTHLSRRTFVRGGLATAFAAPYIVHGRNALGRATMAFIGVGTQGRTLLHQFLGQDVVVTAICDCDRARRENRTKVVNDYYPDFPRNLPSEKIFKPKSRIIESAGLVLSTMDFKAL